MENEDIRWKQRFANFDWAFQLGHHEFRCPAKNFG